VEYEIVNPRLIDLFSKGRSKKYKFLNKAEIDKFMKAIAVIEAAEIVTDLWKMQSLKFEHLESNVYSMRLSKQVRLEMEIDWEDEKKQKGLITIKDITKHYE
jgi:plasmid maintenance system killer protein